MNAVNQCFYPLHVDESGKLNPSRITLIKALSKGWCFFRFQYSELAQGSGEMKKVPDERSESVLLSTARR
jgi:hypothetical protein